MEERDDAEEPRGPISTVVSFAMLANGKCPVVILKGESDRITEGQDLERKRGHGLIARNSTCRQMMETWDRMGDGKDE
jgi:hypothetical protein